MVKQKLINSDNIRNNNNQKSLIDESQLSSDYSTLLSNVGLYQDKTSFAEVFEHFAPRVKSYMVKLGCVEEMAEELAQQTLLQVWRKSQLYDPNKAAASTWIFRIARNMRIDMLRKQKHFFDADFDLSSIEDDQEDAELKINKDLL